jgi:hypothetical protein
MQMGMRDFLTRGTILPEARRAVRREQKLPHQLGRGFKFWPPRVGSIGVVQHVVARDEQNVAREAWEGVSDDAVMRAFPEHPGSNLGITEHALHLRIRPLIRLHPAITDNER